MKLVEIYIYIHTYNWVRLTLVKVHFPIKYKAWKINH